MRARRSDARVDAYHRFLPDLPERQAGYYHEFFCPDHAVQLVFNPRDGHHHACPSDGRVFSGEPFDSAWGWSVNDALSDAALGRRSGGRWATIPAPRGRQTPTADLIRLVRRVLLGLRGALPDVAAGTDRLPRARTGASPAGARSTNPCSSSGWPGRPR